MDIKNKARHEHHCRNAYTKNNTIFEIINNSQHRRALH